MYTEFFGLKESPFSIAPDPRYLFMSERHREALAHLLYGLGGGGGFVLLTGEIGAGKTTVCRAFLEQIPENCNVAYIFNPKLTVIELLRSICDEFHVGYARRRAANATVTDYVEPLNEFLLDAHAEGRNNVLIIDEAQNLAPDVIEQLRLLTNLETAERKLLQIVLIGQPELRTLLARPDMEQLAQRVIARFHLPALSEVETAHYISHRLAVGGRVGGVPFDNKAITRIHKLSRGVPRRINLLCDRALLGAYATGKISIGREIVDKAAREVFDEDAPQSSAPRPADDGAAGSGKTGWAARIAAMNPFVVLGAGMVAGLCLFGAVWLLLHGAGGSAAPAPLAAASSPSPAATGNVQAPNADGTTTSYTPPPLPPPTVGGAPATLGTLPSGTPQILSPPSGGTAGPLVSSGAQVALRNPAPVAAPAVADNAPAAGGVLKAAHRSENDAVRELATLWKLPSPAGDPCAATARQGVECFESKGTLTTVQQLDRPAVLTLYDGSKKPVYALLNGIGPRTATLLVGGSSQTLPLNTLLGLWRGEYATLWKAPASWNGKLKVGASGPPVDFLASRLALLQGGTQPAEGRKFDAVLKSQVAAFQLSSGLKADGTAGAETFMQLNRAIGVTEPRLLAEK